MNIFRLLAGAVLALALGACGGGGGSPGSTPNSNNPDNTTSAKTKVVVELLNASGSKTTNVTPGGGQTVRLTVTDSSGKPVKEKLVTISVEPVSLATLAQNSVLTNDLGVASVAISPVSITSVGAGQLQAEASIGGVATTGTLDFAVQAANLSLSELELSSTNLPSAGNVSIAVTVLQNSQPALGIPINVNFSASCGRINEQAAIGGSVNNTASGVTVPTDGNGKALVSYRAVNLDGTLCRGPVSVNATTTGVALPRTATLNVADPAVNFISFSGALPAQIFVSGSGAQERSLVTFRALANDSPIADKNVTFSIVVNPGGVGLNTTGNLASVTKKTDSKGEVTISVFAGSIPGPVKVRATLTDNDAIFSETQNLTVASGPASQRFMSLSAEKFNIEGWNRDGSSSQLTVRLADRQGNPVENGTVVNFVAEGGQVQPSCATQVVDGISLCSVNFVSQNPRPMDGRVSVLAFLSGTKDYEDLNQNNRFDEDVDTLYKIGDAYRDDNEDAIYNGNEFVIPRGKTELCLNKGAPFPSRANTCDSLLGTTVRQQTTLMFSSSSAFFEPADSTNSVVNFRLRSNDNRLLPMPVGTTVTASTIDGTNNDLSCVVQRVFGSPVPNISPTSSPSADLATFHSVSLKDCFENDAVIITAQAPSGLATSHTVQMKPVVTPPVTTLVPDNIISDAPSPSQIFVAGNGLQERSTAVFRVRSGAVAAGSGYKVKVSIVNNIGGIGIGERGKTDQLLTTDASGIVSVNIFSGTIPTPVKLRAELVDTPTAFVETQNLSISSGPPSQRYMSISATHINLNGGIDGDTTEITARVADRQGNAVPDGTVVNFITEGGQVGFTCTTVTVNKISKCSVILETQEPRPDNGRVSVLAYTEGTKDYIDNNGNNQYDSGDTLLNIGDAYRDDDENDQYDPGETVITRGATGGDCTSNGRAPFPARMNTCDTTLKTTVRQQIVLLFADNFAEFVIKNPSSTGFSVRVNSKDYSLLPMPEGTTISATSLNPACTVGEIFPATVLKKSAGTNPMAELGTNHSISLVCTSGTKETKVKIRVLATAPEPDSSISSQEVEITVPATTTTTTPTPP